MQQLRDNASRFKTEKEIINLILVRRRQEIEPAAESLSAELEETRMNETTLMTTKRMEKRLIWKGSARRRKKQ